MGLFSRKPAATAATYDISDMGGFDKHCLLDCLDLIIKSGMGDQYKGLDEAVKSGTLTAAQLKECGAFAAWYKNLVASQPNLADTFGKSSYDALVNALGSVTDYCNKKLNG